MVIFQKPNVAILTALAAYAVSMFTTGTVHALARVAFTIAIIIWAYEEALHGANWFRKGLGLAVLLFTAWSLFTLQK